MDVGWILTVELPFGAEKANPSAGTEPVQEHECQPLCRRFGALTQGNIGPTEAHSYSAIGRQGG